MGGSEKCWDSPFNIVTAITNNLFQIFLGWVKICNDKKIMRLKDLKCQKFPCLQTEELISEIYSIILNHLSVAILQPEEINFQIF